MDHRVLRGGSYNNEDRNLRCAIRNRNNPNNRNNNLGFRVVVRVVSHASLWKAHRRCLFAQAGNAFHSRMTAEAEMEK
ncbi:MAG: SUMF1/EgtB/PvdO family nonheme iron enzyme [Chloroflexota bacterium]